MVHPLGRAAVQQVNESPIFLYVIIALGWAMNIYSHFGLSDAPPFRPLCGAADRTPGVAVYRDLAPQFWFQAPELLRQAGALGAYLLSLLPAGVHKSHAVPIRLLRSAVVLCGLRADPRLRIIQCPEDSDCLCLTEGN
jgi:hypothetical protein